MQVFDNRFQAESRCSS